MYPAWTDQVCTPLGLTIGCTHIGPFEGCPPIGLPKVRIPRTAQGAYPPGVAEVRTTVSLPPAAKGVYTLRTAQGSYSPGVAAKGVYTLRTAQGTYSPCTVPRCVQAILSHSSSFNNFVRESANASLVMMYLFHHSRAQWSMSLIRGWYGSLYLSVVSMHARMYVTVCMCII